MNSNPANAIDDFMWKFVKDGQQKSNIPALKSAVYDLIEMMTQKTAGQRKDKKKDLNFDLLPMLEREIIIETVCLVLSGDLDKLEKEGEEVESV